jgi:hypothetical protein
LPTIKLGEIAGSAPSGAYAVLVDFATSIGYSIVPHSDDDAAEGRCNYEQQTISVQAGTPERMLHILGSSQAQLLEAKANLQRMLQAIPLSEDERAAVEDGLSAIERLSAQLLDVPTPAGATPRQLATQTIAEAAITIGRPGAGALGGGERSGDE